MATSVVMSLFPNTAYVTHVNLRAIATAVVLFAVPAMAREAPAGMSQFNRECPAKMLLPRLGEAHKACVAGTAAACSQFVELFRQLLPEYDCQRPFDSTAKANYIVPAIWLAGDERLGNYIELLSKLQTSEARRLFASPQLRAILDGHFAEEYLERSEAAQKELAAATVEPTRLPDDVAEFVARRQTCDHFRGEEPYSPERRAQIEAAADQYCRGSDRDLAALRSKYRNNAIVLDRLSKYEAEIEAK